MDLFAAQRLAAAPDPRALGGLLNKSSDPAVAKAVAQQFGSLFMQGLLQQSDGSGMGFAGGTGGGVVNSMFASTMSQAAMSHEKLGLADLMLRSIEAKQRAAGQSQASPSDGATAASVMGSAAPAATAGGAAGFPLSPYRAINGLRPLGAGSGHLRVPASMSAGFGPLTNASLASAAGPVRSATGSGNTTPAPTQMALFTQQMAPLLQAAGAQLGVSPRTLLAQAALETGWGRAVVGNNIFGIKAGSSWTGPAVTTPTHEYENGQLVSVTDAFRSYPTLDAAVRDFVSIMSASSRYRGALNTGEDTGAYASALVAGGWATDIDYVQKLQSVAASRAAASVFASPAVTSGLSPLSL